MQRPPFDPDALRSGAAAALLDLSSPEALREGVAWLRRAREMRVRPRIFVKPPPLAADAFFPLLDALLPTPPDGLLLAAAESGSEAQRLSARLAVFEAEAGLPDGATRILAEIATPAGVLSLARFGPRPPRLAGFLFAGTKLAERLDVAADAAPVRQARAEIVLAAAACGVPALDDACSAPQALQAECLAARRDGFLGKCATRPEEIATIEAAFGGEDAEKSPQSAPYLRA